MKERSLVKNASDSEQVKKAEQAQKNEEEQNIEDIRFLLNTASGKRYVWKLLSRCGIFASPKREKEPDTYIAIGEQNIGNELIAEIVNVDENLLFEMMLDNMNNNKPGGKR